METLNHGIIPWAVFNTYWIKAVNSDQENNFHFEDKRENFNTKSVNFP